MEGVMNQIPQKKILKFFFLTFLAFTGTKIDPWQLFFKWGFVWTEFLNNLVD